MTKKKSQSVSEGRAIARNEAVGDHEEPLLSPQRAFVVQFREGMDATAPRFSGRVEHITSGRATRFHSPNELLEFLAEALTVVRAKPP